MTRIIAIANQKGGTGKTTTAANLGHGLAIKGYDVLLMDLDAQANLTTWFDPPYTRSLYHLLVAEERPERCIVTVRRHEGRGTLDLIPGNKMTAEAKDILVGRRFSERVLERSMRGVRGYDYVLLDCAPSLDILNVNALIYATEVIIPVNVDYFGTVGARQHLESLEEVRAEGFDVQLGFILPTFHEEVTTKSAEILQFLRDSFGDLVADPIRKNVRLAESPSFHQTIWEYAIRSRGARDYAKLVERVSSGR